MKYNFAFLHNPFWHIVDKGAFPHELKTPAFRAHELVTFHSTTFVTVRIGAIRKLTYAATSPFWNPHAWLHAPFNKLCRARDVQHGASTTTPPYHEYIIL